MHKTEHAGCEWGWGGQTAEAARALPGLRKDDLLTRSRRGGGLALLHRHQITDIGEHRFQVRHLSTHRGGGVLLLSGTKKNQRPCSRPDQHPGPEPSLKQPSREQGEGEKRRGGVIQRSIGVRAQKSPVL